MKTKDQEKVKALRALSAVIEQRKMLEKQEQDLKTNIKSWMGEAVLLECEDVCVIRSQRTRRDLDKESLKVEFGIEWMEERTKITSYEILEVKRL